MDAGSNPARCAGSSAGSPSARCNARRKNKPASVISYAGSSVGRATDLSREIRRRWFDPIPACLAWVAQSRSRAPWAFGSSEVGGSSPSPRAGSYGPVIPSPFGGTNQPAHQYAGSSVRVSAFGLRCGRAPGSALEVGGSNPSPRATNGSSGWRVTTELEPREVLGSSVGKGPASGGSSPSPFTNVWAAQLIGVIVRQACQDRLKSGATGMTPDKPVAWWFESIPMHRSASSSVGRAPRLMSWEVGGSNPPSRTMWASKALRVCRLKKAVDGARLIRGRSQVGVAPSRMTNRRVAQLVRATVPDSRYGREYPGSSPVPATRQSNNGVRLLSETATPVV